eukprot:1157933-Pelagomonas_calceolata.AAC.2
MTKKEGIGKNGLSKPELAIQSAGQQIPACSAIQDILECALQESPDKWHGGKQTYLGVDGHPVECHFSCFLKRNRHARKHQLVGMHVPVYEGVEDGDQQISVRQLHTYLRWLCCICVKIICTRLCTCLKVSTMGAPVEQGALLHMYLRWLRVAFV